MLNTAVQIHLGSDHHHATCWRIERLQCYDNEYDYLDYVIKINKRFNRLRLISLMIESFVFYL